MKHYTTEGIEFESSEKPQVDWEGAYKRVMAIFDVGSCHGRNPTPIDALSVMDKTLECFTTPPPKPDYEKAWNTLFRFFHRRDATSLEGLQCMQQMELILRAQKAGAK